MYNWILQVQSFQMSSIFTNIKDLEDVFFFKNWWQHLFFPNEKVQNQYYIKTKVNKKLVLAPSSLVDGRVCVSSRCGRHLEDFLSEGGRWGRL